MLVAEDGPARQNRQRSAATQARLLDAAVALQLDHQRVEHERARVGVPARRVLRERLVHDRRDVAAQRLGVQNGDVMHDPEIVFEFHAIGAEPISFRNDYVGAHDEVYAYDDAGRRTGVYARRRAGLVSFARVWFRNIRAQGFLGEKAQREVIA